jgi:hypothetical protein
MQDPDDLKQLPLDAEQDQVLALGGDLTARKKVFASFLSIGRSCNHRES